MAPQTSIGIENKSGKLRLRLPRSVRQSDRYIYTGLDANTEGYREAQRLAWLLEDDLASGKVDWTFERYKFKPRSTALAQTDLLKLWDLYSDYRKPQIALTTYQREYRGRYLSHLEKLPTVDPSDSVIIRDSVVRNAD